MPIDWEAIQVWAESSSVARVLAHSAWVCVTKVISITIDRMSEFILLGLGLAEPDFMPWRICRRLICMPLD